MAFTVVPPQTNPETVTEPTLTDVDEDDASSDVVLGVVITAIVLLLIVLIIVLIGYMYRHKGTYRTNEGKGIELALSEDAALHGDRALRDTVDDSRKEYFI
ncbi:glycophorin-C [Thalassophryne amazonica]|uniref:glycophorin-C n=1 Tax=Thalassophryne amazonica TaxID=390379 RepID=UPI0014715F21|nr:glycophorin-C [Thalassophryne amazonica]